MLALILLAIVLFRLCFARRVPCGYRLRSAQPTPRGRTRAKPLWVRKEVIRLKALMPCAGCRLIADSFNRRFAANRKMTVGKTFVSKVIGAHLYEIRLLRRQIRRARPRPVPRNLICAMDLTGKPTLDGRTRCVLGILEHASRAALWLEALDAKSSWVLLSRLVLAIRRHGKPRIVRTDNESVVTSRAFRLALWMLGIRQQGTDLHCPWQNGRIERFFGTLKSSLDQLAVDSLVSLNAALAEFRFFYNHLRPHQNLAGATPAEVWSGIDPYAKPVRREYWFEAWDGLLQGFYLRR